jgi:hypothetical protein
MHKSISLIIFIIIFSFSPNNYALTEDYKLTIIKKDLSSPWSFSFINEYEIIISEKTGKKKVLNLNNNNNIIEINHN